MSDQFKEHPVKIIWQGHQNYSTIMKYHFISLLMGMASIYLAIKFTALFLLLLIFPIALSTLKFIQTKKTTFEINDKRIIMKRFEKGKYLTYEVELYDVKHIVEEEKPNGKGHIIFKTTSSLFPDITTPCMYNPTRIHDIVRDIIEERKIERNKMMTQGGGKPKKDKGKEKEKKEDS
ncbi:MAG: hypothetical protein U9N49_10905 [Campylobacterota bacterium]|nr:hypothetical protein [Campylobacterota bacterium]